MRAAYQSVCVSTDGGTVVLTVHGLRLDLSAVDAMHLSDSLRVMANRAIVSTHGAEAMGDKAQ